MRVRTNSRKILIDDMRDEVRDFYIANPPDDIVMDGLDDADRITEEVVSWVDDMDDVEIAEIYVNDVT